MSLLEDIFLQDEADEAQQLERVIEGDEYDERPRSRSRSPDNSDENEPKDDEAEEDKRRVDPSSTKTKRVIKNPRFILNPARLTGPRGIQILPEHFKDFKFKGKGHEKEDLDMVLKKLEHWAYRLYPKFQFEDCLKKMESLGKKRPVMVHLQKIRTDQFISEETVVQKDSSDEETQPAEEPDEFDKLLQQQIDLARATPAPGSVKKLMATPMKDRSPFTMPKATSSPSISDDQKERMMRNRKLAEERRLARLKQNSSGTSGNQDSVIIEVDEEVETNAAKKHNKSYVIDSSDSDGEYGVTSVNQSVTVHVHNGTETREDSNDNSQVVVVSGGTLDDIEMANKSDAVEDNQDVIEIIDIDKDISRNVRTIEQTQEAVEIIEINDPTDQIIERNNKTNDVGGVIEIDDESNQGVLEILDIEDPINKVVDGMIETNDPVAKDVEERISDATEIIEENEKTSTVDVDLCNRVHSPDVAFKNNISTENQSKSPSNNDSTDNENTEQNKIEEIQDRAKISTSTKDVSNFEKDDKIAEEVLEDIMDVDFSDEF